MDKVNIPENHQEICREFAKIARKYNLRKLDLTYRPSLDNMETWNHDINMSWDSGRHEADMNKLVITSTLSVYTIIEDKK